MRSFASGKSPRQSGHRPSNRGAQRGQMWRRQRAQMLDCEQCLLVSYRPLAASLIANTGPTSFDLEGSAGFPTEWSG